MKSTTYMHRAVAYIYAHNNTITVGASWNKQVVAGSTGSRSRLAVVDDQSAKRGKARAVTRHCLRCLSRAGGPGRLHQIPSSHLFDMLIIDEAHEYAHDSSAQERAYRLAEMGKPVLVPPAHPTTAMPPACL